MELNKAKIYDAALACWGFDAQVLTVAEECSELAAATTRFINHKANGNAVAEEAADVEIMIEQLRHNGMNDMIEQQKARKLTRLAQRVGIESDPVSPFAPAVSELLADAREQLEMAEALYCDPKTSKRLSAHRARMAIGLLMRAAQAMISEQQRAEARR
ncbi:hypothetical protein [Mixta intestinalis]|jgi:NTP pyrophosphatase (non-canonical NTP hydrolase)|uniref:Uncharacterized protein n=1 Tax=Mixta intestinalis TaxID=1615494 RepID=A0A6P1Q1C1_9GAMM|nr:hypothetical protein [Mixta intestinalis]QHM71645.1 hypothetical protein C7M51_01936 [Mixta intestinalis]